MECRHKRKARSLETELNLMCSDVTNVVYIIDEWGVYKNKKGCLTTTQSFVNLKSNTMKKSQCKYKAFLSHLQMFLLKNLLYNIYLTLLRDYYQFRG